MLPLTDPILVFAILIFSILIAPILADRFRIPDLVWLLLTGMLLGPKGFGVLERSSAIILLGSVGLLYIMFLAGLEIDLRNFGRNGKRSILFGLLTFAVPQLFGSIVCRNLLNFSWPASILTASMFASHTLLAYPVASRLGITRSEPVTVTVGATIITDTLALLVLAVIADSARGMGLDLNFWMTLSIGMILLVMLIWMGIPRLARWFFNNITEEGNAQFLFVLAIICCCSYFAHLAKMEPIIGAFLVGVAFNRLIPENSILMSRVLFAGNTLFIPFFLLSVGMLVDPSAVITDPRNWLVAATMIVMVIATKYMASWLAAKSFGYRSEERHVMFGLSVVQAAATLAAVMVGYDLGIVDDTVLNGAIAMIAVTSPLGAWVVDRQGRKLAAQMKTVPAPLKTQERLLVLIANPVSATRVLEFSFLLRDTARPGGIYPVTIVRDDGDTDRAVAHGEKLLAYCLTHAASANIQVEPSVRVDVNISDAITRASKALRASIVLAGWHDAHPARARFLGPIMMNMLEACPSRILICRLTQPLNTTQRMIVLFRPLSERRRDLRALLNNIKHLSRQIGADIQAYIVGKNADNLRQELESARPERPVSAIITDSMPEARARMINDILPNDLILLPSERKNSALWTPTHDKLLEFIFRQFSDHNICLAYPDLADGEDDALIHSSDPSSTSFSLETIDLNEKTNLENSLYRMAEKALPGQPEAARDAGQLLLTAFNTYPVELSSGIVMLHAHYENIKEPVLIMARHETEIGIPELKKSAQFILALLSPASSSPERHLKALAELGRMFHNEAVVQNIKKSTTAEQAGKIIAEQQR